MARTRMPSPPVKRQLWPIFICYRRVDGSPAARRLYEVLDKHDVTGPQGQPIQLDVYLDETVPGVANWKEMHRPYLEKARALVVVCTPGARLTEGKADWVHREIDGQREMVEESPPRSVAEYRRSTWSQGRRAG